ncbi:hypothetical protein [Niastella sp. OAS944]|uniref:hypothetical protein n=1 Tax=Niastella sp. OAS944 TaxID=2664089 RepID=UPI003469870A|nr:hypothetical protein [Chitinophagaceae bacterium OAS944]
MKKPFLPSFCICAIVAAGLLYGCGKDKDDNSPSKRMLGIWNITKEVEVNKNTTTGKYSDTTYNLTIPSGLFTIEFRDNGKVYTSINASTPERDTLNWHIHNDSTIMMDDQLFAISNWTSNHLTTTTYYWDNTDSVKQIMDLNR